MIIISWNCRGVSSPRFKSIFRDMIASYNPNILVVLEPRISGHLVENVCKSFSSFSFTRIEAQGFKGEIWEFWQTNQVSLFELDRHNQAFHFKVSKGSFSGLFTIVYGSPQKGFRGELWQFLESLTPSSEVP